MMPKHWMLCSAGAWCLAAASAPGWTAPLPVAAIDRAVVKRGEQAVVTVRVEGRHAGDAVSRYLLWLERRPVPNPVRVEGSNTIIGDNGTGKFPLDVSGWPDGVYSISARADYHETAGAPFRRLDTRVELRVQGGPPPPSLIVRPSTQELRAGEPLRLSIELRNGEALGKFVDASLVTQGQQVLKAKEIPLDQPGAELAAWTSLDGVALNTAEWRAQVLRCLSVRARFRAPGKDALVTLAGAVPPITVRPAEGGADAGVVPSFRGDRPIHLLTSDACMNTFPYPTCLSWRKGGRQVFFESDRPRPDGTAVKGERQLMMADVETGRLTHLATLGVEAPEARGPYHLATSSQFHSDYSPDADLLVYYDMTGHHLYTLRPGGAPVEVLHETQGTIGDPPAISRDGTRIVYYLISPGPTESRYFAGNTSSIFTLEIDPTTGQARREPRMVYAWPCRKSPFSDAPGSFGTSIGCDHVQFCPTDSAKIMYAHEGGYARSGEPENTRIWHIRDDGSENHSLAPAQEKGSYYTHEVYGPLGKYVYAVWGGSVVRIEVATNRFECLYEARRPLTACHIGVSPDEKWIAADMLGGFGIDNDGNGIGGLFLVEAATGKATFLAAFPAGAGHPRHVHPNFSPDGRKVGFTLAEGRSHSQIAWMDVSDIVGK